MFRVELDRRRRELWRVAAERLRMLVHPALDVLEEDVHSEYDRFARAGRRDDPAAGGPAQVRAAGGGGGL